MDILVKQILYVTPTTKFAMLLTFVSILLRVNGALSFTFRYLYFYIL